MLDRRTAQILRYAFLVLWLGSLALALPPVRSVTASQTHEYTFYDGTWGRGKTYQNNWTGSSNCFWLDYAPAQPCYKGSWSDTWISQWYPMLAVGVEQLAAHLDGACLYEYCENTGYSTGGFSPNPKSAQGITYITLDQYYVGLYGLSAFPVNVVAGAKHFNYALYGANWWWTTESRWSAGY